MTTRMNQKECDAAVKILLEVEGFPAEPEKRRGARSPHLKEGSQNV
jgi:hypothetical protein